MLKAVVTNIDLYRYEIHSLVKAFYAEDEVKVYTEAEQGKIPAEAERFMTVDFTADTITVKWDGGSAAASRLQNGKSAEGPDGKASDADALETFARFDEKGVACKAQLKILLYRSLCKMTERTLPWGDLIGIRPTKIATTKLEEGSTPQEAEAFLLDEHFVSKEKAALAVDIAQREARILSSLHLEGAAGYSLYIGIPFCPTTCLYCSFPSFNVALWKDRVDAYLDALETEMEASAQIMQGKILDTVYIGGGTPTTLEPAQLDRMLCALEKYFDLGTSQEFTVEAGRPDSITREKLEVLKRHGVTRISVNPQTMNDETLRVIGRRHSVQETIDTFKLARACGFDNINMDIILGLPGEDVPEVEKTIAGIEALDPDSLTVHSLAIKRASRLREVIDRNGYPVLRNTDETMRIAAEGAKRMQMKPYYLYRQKNMSGNFENVGYAKEGKNGIYNILIMEEKQTILALGAGSVTKRVYAKEESPEGMGGRRIERCDNAKEVSVYIENIAEMIERKRKLFG